MRREEIWLGEIDAHAAIQRGPPCVGAGRSCATQEVHVVVLSVDAPFFFRPVADAEVDPLVLPFRDGHANGYFLRLQLGIELLDVDELKQLHAIQPALRFLDSAAAKQIAGPEGEFALDDAWAHGLVAGDFDRSEIRGLARLRGEGHLRVLPVRAVLFGCRDLRKREAVVPQLVERHLVRRYDELPVARRADLERNLLHHLGEVVGRDYVEPHEVDGRDLHGFAFFDVHGNVDLILPVVQLDVEADDTRVGKAPIRIERLDALEVRVEAGAVEVGLPSPRNNGASPCGEGTPQSSFVHLLDAIERQTTDPDGAFLLASR